MSTLDNREHQMVPVLDTAQMAAAAIRGSAFEWHVRPNVVAVHRAQNGQMWHSLESLVHW